MENIKVDNKNKLIITDAMHCMEIINKLLDKTYPEEKAKYAAYVSMAYFVKNLHVFPKNDIERVLDDEKLNLSISSKLTYELLENAINNKQAFKHYTKRWFHNVKANQELLSQYLDILLQTEDNQQIEDFCNANPVLSKNYFKHKVSNNYVFEKYVIGNNPDLIEKQNLLKEIDVIELIEKGFVKYKDIKNTFNKYSYKLQTIVTQEEVKSLLSHDLNTEVGQQLYDLIRENPIFFITKLKEINPEFTTKLLASPGASTIGEHPKVTTNLLQSILESNSNKSPILKSLITIALDSYKDILFADVKKTIGFMKHEYKTDFLLHIYEQKTYDIFKSLAYFKEELSPQQNQMILIGNFENLLFKHNQSQESRGINTPFDMGKYIKPLLCFSYEELNEKLSELKKNEKINADILLEVEKFILHNKLSENLVENNIKEKKLKI